MKIRTKREHELLVEGGRLLREILHQVIGSAAVGVTGIELAQRAEKLIVSAGGRPAFVGYGKPPFPSALCVSINSCVVHGIPTHHALKAGDIIGFDIGMLYGGLYTDMARTICLPPVTAREEQLIAATNESLDQVIHMLRPGVTVGDVGQTIQSYIEARGFGIVRDLAGHGVGRKLHESPVIPNYGTPGTGERFSKGMVVAIEPMVTLGHWAVTAGRDTWSVITTDGSKAAHVEDTIIITDAGCEAVTR